MNKKELEKQVWIKHRELEIAVWRLTLAEDKLSDSDKEMYIRAIKDNEEKLKVNDTEEKV